MKKPVATPSKTSKWFNIVFKITVFFFLVYLYIKVTTPIPPISNEAKRKLDSLESNIKTLKLEQTKYDEIIESQSHTVDSLNLFINLAKERTTIIREYYHDASTKVETYTPTQIDSFFKQRYSY